MTRIQLENLPHLRALGPALARLRTLARSQRFEPDEVLHRQGEPRDRLMLIRNGHVQVCVEEGPMGERPLVLLGRGDVLGEGLIVGSGVHSNTARALSRVAVFAVARDDLERAVQEDAELHIALLKAANGMLLERLHRVATLGETAQFLSGDTRLEHDLLGDLHVPSGAYWGVHTARALENFPITRTPISHHKDLIVALAWVKAAAAEANFDCGELSSELRDAIVAACNEIAAGKLHSQFVVDVVQGGAGTSTNMNANEVIANRALELLGRTRGDYRHCHPNNHVNRSQSTNDTYPTALKLALLRSNRRLVAELRELSKTIRQKAVEFHAHVKIGRTQLQDAVPMTLRQEFEAWAHSIDKEIDALDTAEHALRSVNLGGTAIGTKLNAPKGFSERAIVHLRQITGYDDLELAADLIESTQDSQAFVLFSGLLKSVAAKLNKVANDLRLLSSGPRAGFNDIRLPARQAGSSIMPGKVNPVIPEVVNQVCFRVIANDQCVTLAAASGQLQLNAFEPIMAAANLESVSVLIRASATLRANCVAGIEADAEALRAKVEHSIGLATALVPRLGYEIATELAQEAAHTGKGVVELVRERKLLDEDSIAALLNPENMT